MSQKNSGASSSSGSGSSGSSGSTGSGGGYTISSTGTNSQVSYTILIHNMLKSSTYTAGKPLLLSRLRLRRLKLKLISLLQLQRILLLQQLKCEMMSASIWQMRCTNAVARARLITMTRTAVRATRLANDSVSRCSAWTHECRTWGAALHVSVLDVTTGCWNEVGEVLDVHLPHCLHLARCGT